eukprot:5581929-Prymnesium_polylepis.2
MTVPSPPALKVSETINPGSPLLSYLSLEPLEHKDCLILYFYTTLGGGKVAEASFALNLRFGRPVTRHAEAGAGLRVAFRLLTVTHTTQENNSEILHRTLPPALGLAPRLTALPLACAHVGASFVLRVCGLAGFAVADQTSQRNDVKGSATKC